MKEAWHYVYYSYEEWGRGYIGKRTSKVPPEQDPYMGSFSDSTFNPTNKIVLAEFDCAEKALAAEVALHIFYKVDINPHFANKARQTSEKFHYIPMGDPHASMTEQQKAIRNLRRSLNACAGNRGFYYCLRSSDGRIIVTRNLRETCRNHGLHRDTIRRVLKGERRQHKGWTITRHDMPCGS